MTEPVTILLIAVPAIIGSVASIVSGVASVVMIFKVIEVHRLVNSQYTQQVQKTADALAKLAEAVPSDINIKAASVAEQINKDRVK